MSVPCWLASHICLLVSEKLYLLERDFAVFFWVLLLIKATIRDLWLKSRLRGYQLKSKKEISIFFTSSTYCIKPLLYKKRKEKKEEEKKKEYKREDNPTCKQSPMFFFLQPLLVRRYPWTFSYPLVVFATDSTR